MASKTNGEASKETVETVQKLLALAADDANKEESRSAAIKAVMLMKKHGLQVISGADLEAAEKVINEARALTAEAKKENRKNLLMGAALGYFVGGGKF